jgi:hypothetical protein
MQKASKMGKKHKEEKSKFKSKEKGEKPRLDRNA